jgi:putative oxidoreductase
MDIGLLIARLVLGLGLSAHGAQKVFGWFGGHGLGGTGAFMESLGFRPGKLFALAAGLGELGGGLLTALGFLGPIGPSLIVLVMVVAMVTSHWSHGFFAHSNGIELPLLYLAGGVALAATGVGAYSLDAVLGLNMLWQPRYELFAVAAGLLLGFATLALRRPRPAAAT